MEREGERQERKWKKRSRKKERRVSQNAASYRRSEGKIFQD